MKNPQALAHLFFAAILFIIYGANIMQENMAFLLILMGLWNGLLGWSKLNKSATTT